MILSKLYFLLWQRMLFNLYFSARCWYLFSMMLDCESEKRTPVCPLVFCSLLWFFFQCTVTGEQAARALQHKAEISWKKTSCTCREVSKHYTRRSGHHKDRTIRSCAPDRTPGTGKKFKKNLFLFFQYTSEMCM